MKPVVKYLLNGEYHYATVKDIGDMEKLKTKVKTDIVSAINELAIGGGNSEVIKDLNDKLVEIENGLGDLKVEIGSGGLNEKQKEQIESLLKEIPQVDYEKINAEIEKQMEETKQEIAQTTESIKNEVSAAKDQISDTKAGLEEAKKDLSEVKLNYNEVTEKYNEVTGELEKTVKSSQFDLLETQVSENEKTLKETVDGVKDSIKRKEWDIAQDRVTTLENSVEKTAEGLKKTMTKEEVRKEINLIDTYRPNLIMGTLDWTGWNQDSSSGVEILQETYQHCAVASINNSAKMISTVSDLVQGRTYQASVWAKITKGGKSNVTVTISGSNKVSVTETLSVDGNKDVSETWRRYSVSIVAPDNGTCTISFQSSGLSTSHKMLLAGSKLEDGSNATGWNVHLNDSYESVKKLSHAVKETADGVKSVTESVVETKQGIEKNTHEIETLSNSQKETIKKVEDVDGETKRLSNELVKTAESLESKITREDMTEIFDGMENGNVNLISNSNFFNDKANWTAGKEWNVVDKAGRNYIYTSRSGLTADMELSVFSEYIPVKQDEKISFGLDMFIDDISKYDVKKPIRIELYDKSNSRLHFKDYQLSELISISGNGHNSRLGGVVVADRKDVAKARIRLSLQRNGGVGFTNISVKIGSITDKSWMPSPGDSGVITAKLETSISQKADGVEVSNIKKEVEKSNQAISDSSAKWKLEAEGIKSDITKNYASKNELGAVEKKATSAQQTADGFKQQVENVQSKVDNLEINGRNLLKDSGVRLENTGYRIGHYLLHEKWESEETYTILISAEISERQKIGIWRDYGSISLSTNLEKVGKNLYRKTFKCPAPSPTDTAMNMLSFYNMPSTPTEVGAINWAILVKGESKIGDWTPAPEDMASQNSLDESNKKISSLEQTANGFKQEVEQVKKDNQANKTQIDQTAKDIAGKVSSVEKKIDGIEVGGRNFYKSELTNISNMTPQHIQGYLRNTEVTPNGFEVTGAKDNGAGAGTLRLEKVITGNGLWTVSFEMRGSQGFDLPMLVDICDKGSKQFATAKDNSWNKYSLTVDVSNYSDKVYNFVDFSSFRWAYYFIRNIKVEKGNKPTDWTPAPEDMLNEIDTLRKDVEFKLTPDEIYGMVSSSSEYQEYMSEMATSEEFDEARSELDKIHDVMEGENGLVTRFGKFEQTTSEFGVTLGDIVQQVGSNNKEIEDMLHFMTFKRGDKPNDAFMSIGSSADSMEVRIGRGKISFFDGGVEVAYFSKQQLYIKKGIMTDSFQVGSHIFENKGNGSTVLTYSK